MSAEPPFTSEHEREALGAQLLAESLREVKNYYRDYNQALFRGRLVAPHFEWTSSEREWGAWVAASRTLRLSSRLISRGWAVMMEVLKHEMAHQFVQEVLGAGADEGPHGAAFQEVCRERGIDSRAGGALSDASELEEGERASVLTRIEHLLALAGSDNQNEAENAMSSARRLMLKYNLEKEVSAGRPDYSFLHLGRATGRRMAWQRVLATLLSEYFFVEIIIVPVYRPELAKRGSILEACGSSANLKIASYVHDFLENTAVNLWRAHKRSNGIRLDRDKQSYLHGVMSGFSKKLEADARRNQEEGLVWVGDPRLAQYFRARHPHVRRVSGRAKLRPEAFSAGHAAGERIVLHRGVEAGSTGGAPKLLGSGGNS